MELPHWNEAFMEARKLAPNELIQSWEPGSLCTSYFVLKFLTSSMREAFPNVLTDLEGLSNLCKIAQLFSGRADF